MRENCKQGLWLIATCLAWTALHPATLQAECRPGDSLPPGDRVIELEFEGENRSFTLHIPPKYDGRTPLPVVFDLHGSSGTSAGQVAASGFKRVSDMYNFILVAPQGYMNFLERRHRVRHGIRTEDQ